MNWKRHIITFVIVFLLIAFFFPRGGCTPGAGPVRPPDADIWTVSMPGMPGDAQHQAEFSYSLRAEVANTPEKRQKGLADRRGLEPGYGMLYVYDEPSRPEFTGGSTPFPLSVAFLKEDGTIVDIRKTEPKDMVLFAPEEDVKYVLEVRSGWFEDRGLGPGDRLDIGDRTL